MAEDKKGFVLYADLIHTVKHLPNETAGLLFKHILAYVNDLNPESDDLLVNISFEPVKQQLKRDLQKYEVKREKWSEAGKASALKKKLLKEENSTDSTNVENVKKNSTFSTVKDTVTVTVKDTVTVINKKDSIDERKLKFSTLLNPFLDKFGKEILNNFYSYWTEHGINDKLMRFEKEKSFGVERRLSTWSKNELKFKQNGNSNIQTTGNLADDKIQRTLNKILGANQR